MIIMSTKCRNNSVAQFISTSDAVITVEPLESELISIPIIDSSSKSDLTANTNGVFSNSDVHNRSSVHIDRSTGLSNATVSIDSLDAEVIRIISVILVQFVEGVNTNIQRIVVFHPTELDIRTNIGRIQMSNQSDVITSGVTNDRIGDELQHRIRVDQNSIHEEDFGFTSRSSLTDENRVHIRGGLIIRSNRRINKDIGMNILDKFTITVPCVILTARNTTVSSSGQSNISALANSVNAIEVILGSDSRDFRNINREGVISNTVLSVEVHQVRNLYNVVGLTENGLEGLDLMSSTRQNVSVVHFILVPLEGQHRIIVVIEISTKRNVTAFADFAGVTGNVRVRSLINIHIERIGNGRTTVAISHFNREDVRIFIGRNPRLTVVVVETRRIRSVLTALKPLVGGIKIRCAVNPSSEDDVLNARTIITNIRVTVNRNDRVTFHVDGVGSNGNELTTRNVVNNVSSVSIINRIAVIDVGLSAERSTMDSLQLHAVQGPHVSQRAVNVIFIFVNKITFCINRVGTISSFHSDRLAILIQQNDRIAILVKFLDVGSDIQLSTLTDIIRRVIIVVVDSNNVVDIDGLEDSDINRITVSLATSVRLNHVNSVHRILTRNVLEDT